MSVGVAETAQVLLDDRKGSPQQAAWKEQARSKKSQGKYIK